jgi:hypothetical protein
MPVIEHSAASKPESRTFCTFVTDTCAWGPPRQPRSRFHLYGVVFRKMTSSGEAVKRAGIAFIDENGGGPGVAIKETAQETHVMFAGPVGRLMPG